MTALLESHSALPLSRRRLFRVAGVTALAAGLLPRALHADDKAIAPSTTGPQSAGYYKFKIGSIDAISISDGAGAISPIHSLFAPEATQEELDAVLTDNFQPLDAARIDFNVLALRIRSNVVLIDTGSGDSGGPSTGRLVARLAEAGIKPEEVTNIIISHAHPDHLFGAVDSVGQAVFPYARYAINKVEHDFWAGNPDLSSIKLPDDAKKQWIAGAQRAFKTINGRLDLVKPGDSIIDGLELVSTPGHTPGHMSVAITDGNEGVFATGDLAHNPVIMFARPDWTIAFDADPKMAVESRKLQFDRIASERLRVFSYHVPWPGLGHIAREGKGYRWVPEAWKFE